MSLVNDPEPEEEPREPIVQPFVPKIVSEKTETFWSFLVKIGHWLGRRHPPKIPFEAKEWWKREVWEGGENTTRARGKRRGKPLKPFFDTSDSEKLKKG